jgi:hypothetical protein
MNTSDETLMAYADGELDEVTRRSVERAMQSDPALAARVARHRALRANVSAAFAPVLEEAVPQRLIDALHAPVRLDQVRAQRTAKAGVRQGWSWAQWGGLAAMLIVGIVVARSDWLAPHGDALVAASDGVRTAQGKLADALTLQLASAPPAGQGVKIGVSFLSKEGTYCRSFALERAAGLACRQGGQWRIPVMVDDAAQVGAYRQAGSAMPVPVLEAIDQRIEGKALDAAAEKNARELGWKH